MSKEQIIARLTEDLNSLAQRLIDINEAIKEEKDPEGKGSLVIDRNTIAISIAELEQKISEIEYNGLNKFAGNKMVINIDGEDIEFTIVDTAVADSRKREVSIESPMVKAALEADLGNTFRLLDGSTAKYVSLNGKTAEKGQVEEAQVEKVI